MFFAYRGTSLLMTVSAAPAAPATDEDLLIQEALRQRRRQRTGMSLAGALALAVFFAVAGFVLAAHPGVVTYGMPYPFSPNFLGPVLTACGVVALLIAASFVVTAVSGALPGEAWGEPLPGDCPACGQPALRSAEVTVWEASTLQVVASGTVTLCESPDCPHATARPARGLAGGLAGAGSSLGPLGQAAGWRW
jgi:hypothetical protein